MMQPPLIDSYATTVDETQFTQPQARPAPTGGINVAGGGTDTGGSSDASNGHPLPPVQHEKFADFIERAVDAIRERFPDEELGGAFAKLVGTRKRRNVSVVNEEWNDTIRSCLKDLEKSTRVSFLLRMNNSHKPYLLEYYNQQFPFHGPMKTYMLDMADARIKQNCATWKYRVTERLIKHVNTLMSEDERFRDAKVKKRIVRYLKGKFSLDTFATIFDFVKDWINLSASKPSVHKWCRSLYLELASTAKMHVNWLNEPNETRLATSKYSRAAFGDRISTCAVAVGWAHLVPSMDDIVLVERTTYTSKKKQRREILQPDDDKDFYVPGDSDSDLDA